MSASSITQRISLPIRIKVWERIAEVTNHFVYLLKWACAAARGPFVEKKPRLQAGNKGWGAWIRTKIISSKG
jgi:hypothetical protein